MTQTNIQYTFYKKKKKKKTALPRTKFSSDEEFLCTFSFLFFFFKQKMYIYIVALGVIIITQMRIYNPLEKMWPWM